MMHAMTDSPVFSSADSITGALPDSTGGAHGGDLTTASARWGSPAQGWVDLSTGINPWPWPVETASLESAAWSRLPSPSDLARLADAAAIAYGAPGGEVVAAAPGTEIAIRLLPRLVPPGRVGIVGPTYGGHAPAWQAADHQVTGLESLPDPTDDRLPDTVVVTNPNNPDGRRAEPAALLDLADALASRGGRLVVDEAFADVAPALSVAGSVARPGLIVLRSFGKFYGLAGLRLGFVLAAPETATVVKNALGAWPVSGPALAIGTEALCDTEWRTATRRRLAEASSRLDSILGRAGLTIVGGTDLFRLVETPNAATVAERLGRSGIHVRDFAAYPTWLRIGLPASRAAEERLVAALAG